MCEVYICLLSTDILILIIPSRENWKKKSKKKSQIPYLECKNLANKTHSDSVNLYLIELVLQKVGTTDEWKSLTFRFLGFFVQAIGNAAEAETS